MAFRIAIISHERTYILGGAQFSVSGSVVALCELMPEDLVP